jgi:hypothetical protein
METRLGHSDDLMPKIPKADCLDLAYVAECQKVPAARSDRTAMIIRSRRADPNRRMLIAFTVARGCYLLQREPPPRSSGARVPLETSPRSRLGGQLVEPDVKLDAKRRRAPVFDPRIHAQAASGPGRTQGTDTDRLRYIRRVALRSFRFAARAILHQFGRPVIRCNSVYAGKSSAPDARQSGARCDGAGAIATQCKLRSSCSEWRFRFV